MLVFRVHAIKRMFERGITVDDVRMAVDNGEVIEDYPDDFPYPSCLILGQAGGRQLHVVVAENAAADETIVVTVYEPDPDHWDASFKRRKTL